MSGEPAPVALVPAAGRRVFVSYRRKHGAYAAELIFQRLAERLGEELVFYDVAEGVIPPGMSFPERLRDGLRDCEIVLVVIDPEWTSVCYEADQPHGPRRGDRRINDPADWVRIELETALAGLANKTKAVLPLLCVGSKPLVRAELPESLQPLADLQLIPLRHGPEGQQDLERVAQEVGRRLGLRLCPALCPVFSMRPRNEFFTGRYDELVKIERQLAEFGIAVLSALGGMGKSAAAIEYVYRHAAEYRLVFWMVTDTATNLRSGLVKLAEELSLPQAIEPEQREAVRAAQRWLEQHDGWLLVLDNVDTVEMLESLREHLPRQRRGHVLITTRKANAAVIGVPQPIEIHRLAPNDAHEFLRRRTGRAVFGPDSPVGRLPVLSPEGPESEALVNLAADLGYLPLALEQAAAYIRDRESLTIVEYRHRLSEGDARVQLSLLERKPPEMGDRQWRSLAVTWQLNFDEIGRESQASADLLRLMAFLNPDDIPFELITSTIREPSDLHDLLAPLRRYSLIDIDRAKSTISMHRLVQLVVRANLDPSTERVWAERTVAAIDAAFPEPEPANSPDCRRLLPHAEAGANLIEHVSMENGAAARLLDHGADYLRRAGRLQIAEDWCRAALAMREKLFGLHHTLVATSLNTLGMVLRTRGRYAEAEPMLCRAIDVREESLGSDHLDVAESVNNLAGLYREEGRYADAEPLYRRALEMRERLLGNNHGKVIESVNNLALVCQNQGRYSEAERLFRRALETREILLSQQHPDLAQSLNNLAYLLATHLARYDEAEAYYERALGLREEWYGSHHPAVALSLYNLANLYKAQGDHGKAEPLHVRALAIRTELFGQSHPLVASSLNGVAELYRAQGRHTEAEPLYRRALEMREELLGPEHPYLAITLDGLAELYRTQGRHTEAEPLHNRALAMREKLLGPAHPDVARSLDHLALLYRVQGRNAEAESLHRRALAIARKTLGEEHPETRLIAEHCVSQQAREEDA